MHHIRRVLAIVALLAAAGLALEPVQARDARDSEALTLRARILMQIAMQTFIEDRTINGVFSFSDLSTDNPVELYPHKMHTMIVDTGARYVLCFDFRTRDGQPFDLDFYIERAGETFEVAEVRSNVRGGLERLIETGRAWITQ